MSEQSKTITLENEELKEMYSSTNSSVNSRIVLTLEGSPADGGHVRLSELIEQLELLKNALSQTEKLVTGEEQERFVYYRIVDLSHNSPARIVVEPATQKQIDPRIPKETVKNFFSNLNQIKQRQIPEGVDWQLLESYRDLSALLTKNVSHLSIEALNGHKTPAIDITPEFREIVNELIGEDEIVKGSLSGSLEWLNLHNRNVFHIYPAIGARKIVCKFPKALKKSVISAIDKHVQVSGDLRYKQRDNFPYAINVEEIEILPSDEELPTLLSLRGIAPQITGNMTAYEFIRTLRDG